MKPAAPFGGDEETTDIACRCCALGGRPLGHSLEVECSADCPRYHSCPNVTYEPPQGSGGAS